MIELRDIRYCRLGTRDLSAAEWFATQILGLEVADRTKRALFFKSDDRDHTLCYFHGEPEDQTTAFEVGTSEDLDAAANALESAGHKVERGTAAQCEQRRVRDCLGFSDPSGNKIELVLRPAHSARRYHGTRDAGVTGFSHVGLFSTNPARDEFFWTTVFNARVSDRLGDAPLMRINPCHHTIAILPRTKPGIHHINHQVESTDDVQRSNALLNEQRIPIVFGPGRHPASSAQFLYFTGPDEVTYEYSVGVRNIFADDEPIYRERQLEANARGACQWGAQPIVKLI